MKVSNELTALIFELQRARSPADKAKALARAWRTLRGLSSGERRLLVREVGFDGAEDLVEGLAGKSGGLFAPAAVLEALGKMRNDESMTVRRILADLRDPERREDLLVRGIDLVTDDGNDDAGDEIEPSSESPVEELEEDLIEPRSPLIDESEVTAEDSTDDGVEEPVVATEPARPVAPAPPPPPVARRSPRLEPPDPADEADETETEPRSPDEDDSTWDTRWDSAPVAEPAPADVVPAAETPDRGDRAIAPGAEASVFRRLQAFRRRVDELRGAGARAVIEALDDLPEPWARRRALVGLVEAGIPASAGEALDLIEGLERPMDRRWCLSALARRGDLEGEDLERGLDMLSSPAARRRVKALAGGA